MSYVDVAGRRTWHEVSGHVGDRTVVLLHGAFSGASSWAAQTGALVEAGFRVYVPERRGHAHTPDVEGPLTYSMMADDTIAYLDQEVGGPAHLVGWSDGAVVALLVAQRRPELVDRMVLIGQYYNSAGRSSDSGLDEMLATEEAMGFLRVEYDQVSPDGPEHFPVVHAKTVEMFRTEPELDLDSFAGLAAPTLVLQGDRDEVTVEHSLALVRTLPDARLAVIPGSHLLPLESPAVVNPLLVSFLRDAVPAPPWDEG